MLDCCVKRIVRLDLIGLYFHLLSLDNDPSRSGLFLILCHQSCIVDLTRYLIALLTLSLEDDLLSLRIFSSVYQRLCRLTDKRVRS